MNLPNVLTEVPHWDEPKFENPLAVRADSDGDGVPNPWDCQPFNSAEQGWFDDKVRSFAQRTGRRLAGGAQRYARRSMPPSQHRQMQQRNRDLRLKKQKQRQQKQRKQTKRQQAKRQQTQISRSRGGWQPHYVSHVGSISFAPKKPRYRRR